MSYSLSNTRKPINILVNAVLKTFDGLPVERLNNVVPAFYNRSYVGLWENHYKLRHMGKQSCHR